VVEPAAVPESISQRSETPRSGPGGQSPVVTASAPADASSGSVAARTEHAVSSNSDAAGAASPAPPSPASPPPGGPLDSYHFAPNGQPAAGGTGAGADSSYSFPKGGGSARAAGPEVPAGAGDGGETAGPSRAGSVGGSATETPAAPAAAEPGGPPSPPPPPPRGPGGGGGGSGSSGESSTQSEASTPHDSQATPAAEGTTPAAGAPQPGGGGGGNTGAPGQAPARPARPLVEESQIHENASLDPKPDDQTKTDSRIQEGPIGANAVEKIAEETRAAGTAARDMENQEQAGNTGAPLNIDAKKYSEALGRPVVGDDVVNHIENDLPRVGRDTLEAKAYANRPLDQDPSSIYKLYDRQADQRGTGLGLTAKMEMVNGRPVVTVRRGTIADMIDKATVLSHLGMPTEVVGVTKDGGLLTKQPFAHEALDAGSLKDHIEAIGGSEVSVSGHPSLLGRFVVNIGGDYYLISDLHLGNVKGNSSGNARPIDLAVGRLSQADLNMDPELARAAANVRDVPISPKRPF
jgi:hypothetical protein